MKYIFIFIVVICLGQGSSCTSFEKVVAIELRKENNITIVGSLLDTASQYYILVNKTSRLDTLNVEEYLDKIFIKDAVVTIHDPQGKIYVFKYGIISKKKEDGSIKIPQIDGYMCPRFPIMDGNYTLTVEWNGTKYESVCAAVSVPKLESVEIVPVAVDESKTSIINPVGKTWNDFSNWCDIYFTFNKEDGNYFITYYERLSKNPIFHSYYFTNIGGWTFDKDFFNKHKYANYSSIRLKIDSDGYDEEQKIYRSYPATGYGVNIGDTIRVRVIALNELEIKIRELSSVPTLSRTNIKNITNPNKPPIGYFVVNRYIDKIAIRTK